MNPQSTGKTWRSKFTLAAITGLVSGVARAITGWALDHLASH
jgi:hypothetical protein